MCAALRAFCLGSFLASLCRSFVQISARLFLPPVLLRFLLFVICGRGLYCTSALSLPPDKVATFTLNLYQYVVALSSLLALSSVQRIPIRSIAYRCQKCSTGGSERRHCHTTLQAKR